MDGNSGPRCPNHNVPLVSCQRTGPHEGIGVCPVSTCRFEYTEDDIETDQPTKVDKYNGLMPASRYKLTPLDGEGG